MDNMFLFLSSLDDAETINFQQDWHLFQPLLRSTTDTFAIDTLRVQHYVNGKHLACPMPLLKLKMALKNTQVGNGVYVTATDPNSTQDIGAFCRHLGYEFADFISDNGEKVFHILVQKTL